MVITFPHMGPAYISIKALFEELGLKIIVPPAVSKKTLEIGTKLSPELACLPLKINMGNYIESIEKGADTIVITGSCGPCRFGYYGIVQKEILKDLGYDVDVIILDPPKNGIKEFVARIRKLAGNNSVNSILSAVFKAFKVTEEVDELIELSLKTRCREINKGETDRVMYQFEKAIRETRGVSEIRRCIAEYKERLRAIDIDKEYQPLKVGLVGEIYTLIEPFVNLNVERKLGNMGVEVYRGLTLNGWVKYHLAPDIKFRLREKRILKKADPYLGLCIGGHAWQTVAHTVNFADMGLNGVIQIMPFGCMPEIVAESILPTISEQEGIPAMTLIVDEMTGEAGYQTRLEAFIDLLRQEEENKKNEYKKVLSWN